MVASSGIAYSVTESVQFCVTRVISITCCLIELINVSLMSLFKIVRDMPARCSCSAPPLEFILVLPKNITYKSLIRYLNKKRDLVENEICVCSKYVKVNFNILGSKHIASLSVFWFTQE